MRIGVNALYLIPGGVGGTETYLRNLLAALAGIDTRNQYVVFTNRETGDALTPAGPNFRTSRQPVRAVLRPARILWEQTALPLAAARERLDVLLNPGFTMPALCPCPSVTVFHDLQHIRHPEFFRRLDLPAWRLLLRLAARRSRLLVADSEATQADLQRFYGVPAAKIRCVPLGVSERFFEIGRQRAGVAPERYLLAVSTLHPHKNLDRLVRAFARFREQNQEFRLVIAGMRGFFASELEALILELGLGTCVELTGWVSQERLEDLYLRAWGYINPTLFEGFGLPVLEALAAGVPAACSAIEPVRSIAGDAALLFDPASEEAISGAMSRITGDPALRTRLAAAGPLRAALFTWRKTAEGTLQALEESARPRLREPEPESPSPR